MVQKSITTITTYGIKKDIQVRVKNTEGEDKYFIEPNIDILEPNTAYTLHITQKQARCLLGILKTMESDGII